MIRTVLTASALALAGLPAIAQGETGTISATCQIQGQASPMQMNYTRYRDTVVWSDRHGTNSSATDMGQWGTVYWEGRINTPYGPYNLSGENQFIEAMPVGGVYSDKITLEISQTSPNSFTMRDFFNDGPVMPCQIHSQ